MICPEMNMSTSRRGADWLTALDLQRAVLLVQRVSPQVHHAGRGGGDPAEQRQRTVGINRDEAVLPHIHTAGSYRSIQGLCVSIKSRKSTR